MSFNLFTYYNQDKEYTSLKVSLCPMGKPSLPFRTQNNNLLSV